MAGDCITLRKRMCKKLGGRLYTGVLLLSFRFESDIAARFAACVHLYVIDLCLSAARFAACVHVVCD